MYKLYTDKPETFECEVSVRNASLKNSMARLVVESAEGVNFVFNGKIEGDKCTIPIRRLKGLLNENSKGNMHLEVIVEDTYFRPWKSDFIVEEHTSVKVKVNEAIQSNTHKPMVEIKSPVKEIKVIKIGKKGANTWIPLHEITQLCEKFNIKKSNIVQKKEEFRNLIREYFDSNPDFSAQKSTILNNLKHFLK